MFVANSMLTSGSLIVKSPYRTCMAIGKRQTLDWLAAAELNRTGRGQPGLRWVHVMINNPLNRQKTRIELHVPVLTLHPHSRTCHLSPSKNDVWSSQSRLTKRLCHAEGRILPRSISPEPCQRLFGRGETLPQSDIIGILRKP